MLKNTQKRQLFYSVMSYITLSLLTIIAVTLLSILFSYWMTEQADNDAHVINLSGSMRMQTFQIGLAATHEPDEVKVLIEKLDRTWNDSLFNQARAGMMNATPSTLGAAYSDAFQHWQNVVRPVLMEQISEPAVPDATLFALLRTQVDLIDTLVNRFQMDAESKIQRLRAFQLIAILLTALVGSLIFYLLKNRVALPLSRLTEAAKGMRDGYLQQHIKVSGKDELALLAEAFNQMSRSISDTYQQLEQRVEQRTRELQQSNTILEYSFHVARKVLEEQDRTLDYSEIIHELSSVLTIEDVELSLFTDQGQRPYIHLDTEKQSRHQSAQDPFNSFAVDKTQRALDESGADYQYPVTHLDKQYGVITIRPAPGRELHAWQEQLAQSSADQLAIALYLQESKEQERRLAMLSERTVMARELHDSLAQSLSYLKIQVTRLQKSHDQKKYDLQQPIIDELSEGLSSAYRHLRELLTTFRLQIDASGLYGAIEQSIKLLKARSEMKIEFHYQLKNVPLNPTEEIHLLQIMREASQNAVNHSRGEHLLIHLTELPDKQVQLIIQDDGVGLSRHPEKLNHYGLAIIKERSRHLQGKLLVQSAEDGLQGTRIELCFTPLYLREVHDSNLHEKQDDRDQEQSRT